MGYEQMMIDYKVAMEDCKQKIEKSKNPSQFGRCETIRKRHKKTIEVEKNKLKALEAQQADRWIPVSEKPIDMTKLYEVSVKYENFAGIYETVRVASYNGNNDWTVHGPQPLILNRTITAYRDLPEPWKGEQA